jgi:hypothetical protein
MHVASLAPLASNLAPAGQYFLHLVLTLTLFIANMLLNHLLGGHTFIGRLKYVGHEMAYLASGLVASHLFVSGSVRDSLVTVVTVVIYLVVWIFIILMTRRVIQINPKRIDGLTCATIFVGILSIWSALSSFVETQVSRGLPGVP